MRPPFFRIYPFFQKHFTTINKIPGHLGPTIQGLHPRFLISPWRAETIHKFHWR